MLKRLFLLFVTLAIAVAAVLLAAQHPTGPNSVSYEEPIGVWLSIGMIIVLFLPAIILTLLNKRMSRIISAVYQVFIVFAFVGIVPIGFLFPENIGVSIIAILGTLTSIGSVVLTLRTNRVNVG